MGCKAPLSGWMSRERNPKTKRRGFTRDPSKAFTDRPMTIPCGQCAPCRLKRKADWATRIEKEAVLFEQNCFVTLTYDEEHLPRVFSPVDGVERCTLAVDAIAEFLRALRCQLRDDLVVQLREAGGTRVSRRGVVRYNLGWRAARREAAKRVPAIRYFGCGEFGETTGRAHYHVAIFGWDSVGADRDGSYTGRSGFEIRQSKVLSKVWPFGHHTVQSLTWESGAYVAGYIGKAITGLGAVEAYDVHGVARPFQAMSRMPGIGRVWLEHFGGDVYPSGTIVLRGGKQRSPPPYFDRLFRDADPAAFAALRSERRVRGLAAAAVKPVGADYSREVNRRARERAREPGGA